MLRSLNCFSNNNNDVIGDPNCPLLITSKEVWDQFSQIAYNPEDIKTYAKKHSIPSSNVVITGFTQRNKLANIQYNGELQLFFHGSRDETGHMCLWVYNYNDEKKLRPIEFYNLLEKSGLFNNPVFIRQITFDACNTACPIEISGKLYASYAEQFYEYFMKKKGVIYNSRPPIIKAADGESYLNKESGKRLVKPGNLKQLGEWRYINSPQEKHSGMRKNNMKVHKVFISFNDGSIEPSNIGRIPHDGHCLFRSISYLVNNQDCHDNAVLNLRIAIKRIATEDIVIKNSLYSGSAIARLNNLSAMDLNIVWGGDEEIRLLSHYLQRPIYLHHLEECKVYIFDGLNDLEIKDLGTNMSSSSNSIMIYYRDSHFDVVKF